MTEEDESRSIAAVVAELERRFPGVPAPVVERMVETHYRAFEGAPVREYIPVMVRRSARNSLAVMVQDSRERYR